MNNIDFLFRNHKYIKFVDETLPDIEKCNKITDLNEFIKSCIIKYEELLNNKKFRLKNKDIAYKMSLAIAKIKRLIINSKYLKTINVDGLTFELYGDDLDLANKKLLQLVEIINSLSIALKKIIKEIKFKLVLDAAPDNYYFTLEYNQGKENFTSVGIYNDNIITLWYSKKEYNIKLLKMIIMHEIGHHLDHKLIFNEPFSQTDYWHNTIKKDKNKVSDYGNIKQSEDFADSFMFYLTNEELFKKKCPNRYKTIKSYYHLVLATYKDNSVYKGLFLQEVDTEFWEYYLKYLLKNKLITQINDLFSNYFIKKTIFDKVNLTLFLDKWSNDNFNELVTSICFNYDRELFLSFSKYLEEKIMNLNVDNFDIPYKNNIYLVKARLIEKYNISYITNYFTKLFENNLNDAIGTIVFLNENLFIQLILNLKEKTNKKLLYELGTNKVLYYDYFLKISLENMPISVIMECFNIPDFINERTALVLTIINEKRLEKILEFIPQCKVDTINKYYEKEEKNERGNILFG